jgi:hypothetical protein
MGIEDDRRAAEAAFMALLVDADLAPPDRVEDDGTDVLFFWDEPGVVVIVDTTDKPEDADLEAA